MLINQILFQQRLGQESNCTILFTTTTDINGLRDGQRAGKRRATLRCPAEEYACAGR